MIHFKEDWYSQFATNEDLLVFLFLCVNCNADGYVEISYKELIDGSRINMKKGSKLFDLLNRLVSMNLITIDNAEKKNRYHIVNPSKVICRSNVQHAKISEKEGSKEPEVIKVASKPKEKPAQKPKPKTVEVSPNAFDLRIKEVYPNVSKMLHPLDINGWNKLIKEGYTKEEIIHMLGQLDNYRKDNKPCYMCYNTALATIRNWLKMDHERKGKG